MTIFVKELAERLGKHPRSIRRRIKDGTIPPPTVREGRSVGWPDTVIERWLHNHRKDGGFYVTARRHRHRASRKRVGKTARAARSKERLQRDRDRDDVSRLLSWGTSRSVSIYARHICDIVYGFRDPRG